MPGTVKAVVLSALGIRSADKACVVGKAGVVAGDWTGGICNWDLTGGRMLGVGH